MKEVTHPEAVELYCRCFCCSEGTPVTASVRSQTLEQISPTPTEARGGGGGHTRPLEPVPEGAMDRVLGGGPVRSSRRERCRVQGYMVPSDGMGSGGPRRAEQTGWHMWSSARRINKPGPKHRGGEAGRRGGAERSDWSAQPLHPLTGTCRSKPASSSEDWFNESFTFFYKGWLNHYSSVFVDDLQPWVIM